MISFNQIADTFEAGLRMFAFHRNRSAAPAPEYISPRLQAWLGQNPGREQQVWGRYNYVLRNPRYSDRVAMELERKGVGGPVGRIWGRPLAGKNVAKSTIRGLNLHGIAAIGALDLAISTGMAPRGQKLSHAAGSVAGTAMATVGTMVGGSLAGMPGALAGGLVGDWLGRTPAMAAFQAFQDLGRGVRQLEVGQGWQDSQPAYTMRQRAAQELGGSLLNARQILGREARMMHN